MERDKVRAISSARLRLDARLLRQAEGLARAAGVSVVELIETLLIGVLDVDAGQLLPSPARKQAPQPRSVARRTARVLVMDDYRRRASARSARSATPDRGARDIRQRASSLCRRAAELRVRSSRAREAAGRARETARLALDATDRLMTRAS